jgi:hypothetical protein
LHNAWSWLLFHNWHQLRCSYIIVWLGMSLLLFPPSSTLRQQFAPLAQPLLTLLLALTAPDIAHYPSIEAPSSNPALLFYDL